MPWIEKKRREKEERQRAPEAAAETNLKGGPKWAAKYFGAKDDPAPVIGPGPDLAMEGDSERGKERENRENRENTASSSLVGAPQLAGRTEKKFRATPDAALFRVWGILNDCRCASPSSPARSPVSKLYAPDRPVDAPIDLIREHGVLEKRQPGGFCLVQG